MRNVFKTAYLTIFVFTILMICASINNSIAKTKLGHKYYSNQSDIRSSSNKILTANIEHMGFNVKNPVAVAEWYIKNLGMKLVRKGTAPLFVTFISDKGNHMMMEFYNKEKFPKLDFSTINYMSFHFAFMVDSINTVEKRLLKNGATLVEGISQTPAGDKVLMLRDPWGMPLQLVERIEPMLKFTNIRPEHFATNTPDAQAKANWYSENLGMKIFRQGGAPDFGSFVSDSENDMMLEIYQKKNYPMLDYKVISPVSIHLAFKVNNVELVKEKLVAAGADLVDDIAKSKSGDKVLVLRDPWGFPIQFIQRVIQLNGKTK